MGNEYTDYPYFYIGNRFSERKGEICKIIHTSHTGELIIEFLFDPVQITAKKKDIQNRTNRTTRSKFKAAPIPTPDEIEERALEIRKKWKYSDGHNKRGGQKEEHWEVPELNDPFLTNWDRGRPDLMLNDDSS
jgi:hypothetical protein